MPLFRRPDGVILAVGEDVINSRPEKWLGLRNRRRVSFESMNAKQLHAPSLPAERCRKRRMRGRSCGAAGVVSRSARAVRESAPACPRASRVQDRPPQASGERVAPASRVVLLRRAYRRYPLTRPSQNYPRSANVGTGRSALTRPASCKIGGWVCRQTFANMFQHGGEQAHEALNAGAELRYSVAVAFRARQTPGAVSPPGTRQRGAMPYRLACNRLGQGPVGWGRRVPVLPGTDRPVARPPRHRSIGGARRHPARSGGKRR